MWPAYEGGGQGGQAGGCHQCNASHLAAPVSLWLPHLGVVWVLAETADWTRRRKKEIEGWSFCLRARFRRDKG